MDKIPSGMKFHNIWLFVTGRCNLACDYCFFRGRDKQQTLSVRQIHSLLEALPRGRSYDFVFSGGEPLLAWPLVKKSIALIQRLFPQSDITLQTNMFFFDKKTLAVLRSCDAVIEPGLDGAFFANHRHRIGFELKNFSRCLRNISLAVKSRLRMSPTMTVVPSETRSLFDNFSFLRRLGLKAVEVHPAFRAGWNRRAAEEFLRQYRKILLLEKKEKQHLVGKGYSVLGPMATDLVVQPDGLILPNWTYLTFPSRVREQFSLMKLRDGGVSIHQKRLGDFLKETAAFYRQPRSYRQFSNFNAARILRKMPNAGRKNEFKRYESLCRDIETLDRCFMDKEDFA
ncbi:MAG: radical SAM protein [Candidatus Omnitrophota bacterium]